MTTLNTFSAPTGHSYLMGQAQLNDIARILDTDGNQALESQELSISDDLLPLVDLNGDKSVSIFEFVDALQNDKVSLQAFSAATAGKVASALIKDAVYASSLGLVGKQLDTDEDGKVSTQELASALESGELSLQGKYLTDDTAATNNLESAKAYIASVRSQIMKKYPNSSSYNPTTGLFTPEQANQRIQEFLEKVMVPSDSMNRVQKLSLVDSLVMKKAASGYFNLSSGILKPDQAEKLRDALWSSQSQLPVAMQDVKEYITLLQSNLMHHYPGSSSYDPTSGRFTPQEAGQRVQQLLEKLVLPADTMSMASKLRLLDSLTMRKDSHGYDNHHSGLLTQKAAEAFSQQVLSTSHLATGINAAQGFIANVKTLTMKLYPGSSYPNPTTGLYTPAQARQKIQEFLDKAVMPSPAMSLANKLRLIDSLTMRRNASGYFATSTGVLTANQAEELREKVFAGNHHFPTSLKTARKYIEAVRDHIMDKYPGSTYSDPTTGLFSHQQATKQIKRFLEEIALASQSISLTDKLALIDSLTMRKQSNGYYDQSSGHLTQEEARRLREKLLG